MYDFSQPNDKPGQCVKCKGKGKYYWGPTINGKSKHAGDCYSCGGTGKQTQKDISRNHAYNRHKLANLSSI